MNFPRKQHYLKHSDVLHVAEACASSVGGTGVCLCQLPPWHTAIFSVEGVQYLFTADGFKRVRVQPAPSGDSRGLVGVV